MTRWFQVAARDVNVFGQIQALVRARGERNTLKSV